MEPAENLAEMAGGEVGMSVRLPSAAISFARMRFGGADQPANAGAATWAKT
jgi:hypothetical protein